MSSERASLLATFSAGFETLAARDLQRADPRARAEETLERGLWHVLADDDDPDARRLVTRLRVGAMAFRHLHPVQRDREVSDLTELVALATELGARLEPGLSHAVQTRIIGKDHAWPKAFAINDAIAESLAARGLAYDRRAPEQVLSVTLAGARAMLGVSRTRDNLSSWPGGVCRFAKGGAPSRSANKLLEALEAFDLDPRRRAIDLGAAPGGWTHVLAERGLEVHAVDPAELDPAVLMRPNVHHHRMTAERFLDGDRQPVELIVSDMRMDARDAARLLAGFGRVLVPGGQLMTTLKLPSHNALAVLDEALDILDRAYRRVAARQLFHNRSELTALFMTHLPE